jgi:hypothetical protein
MMAMSTEQLGAKYMATGLVDEGDLAGYARFAADRALGAFTTRRSASLRASQTPSSDPHSGAWGALLVRCCDQWSTPGPPVPWSLQSFGLGWFGLNGAETAWYDDVAFASCRIGCQ